jgi:hypothetical protein
MADSELDPRLKMVEAARSILNAAAQQLTHEIEPAVTYNLAPHAVEPDFEAAPAQ